MILECTHFYFIQSFLRANRRNLDKIVKSSRYPLPYSHYQTVALLVRNKYHIGQKLSSTTTTTNFES